MTPISDISSESFDVSKLYENLMGSLGLDPAGVDAKTLQQLFGMGENLKMGPADQSPYGKGAEGKPKKVLLSKPNFDKAYAADFDKLLACLQTENSQLQLEQAKKRYQNMDKKLDETAKFKNEKLEAQAKEMSRQETQSLLSKILSGIAMALAIAIAVLSAVATFGADSAGAAAVIVCVIAIASATFSAATFVLDVSGGNEAIVESLAKNYEGPNCNHREAKQKAQQVWGYVQMGIGIALAIGSMGAGFASGAAEGVSVAVKTAQYAMSGTQLALGLAQTGTGLWTTLSQKDAAKEQAELIELDTFINRLSQNLSEMEEDLNKIIEMLESGFGTLQQFVDETHESFLKLATAAPQYG